MSFVRFLFHFSDPLSNHHNVRSGSIEFTSETSGMLHGVAGYFESVLYKDVMLSKQTSRLCFVLF